MPTQFAHKHPESRYFRILVYNTKNRDFATAASRLLRLAASRHATGAASGVRRARHNVGTTRACARKTSTRVWKSRFSSGSAGWSQEVVGGRFFVCPETSVFRSGIVRRAQGSSPKQIWVRYEHGNLIFCTSAAAWRTQLGGDVPEKSGSVACRARSVGERRAPPEEVPVP